MNEQQFQIGDRVQSKYGVRQGKIVAQTVGGDWIVQTALGPTVMAATELLPADPPPDEQELFDDLRPVEPG